MQIQSLQRRSRAGFSMIEVMIAVLVLAVGLLALVGLQSNLVRGAADAKARSRIAALVSSKMDEARAGGYTSIPIGAAISYSCAANNDVCQAQNEAAVAGLSVSQGAVKTTDVNQAEYKTVTVTAAWNDVTGTGRSLTMVSAVSPLSLDASNTLLNQQLSGDSSKVPIVRTDNPATAGVVPIAMGNGSSSAASNPTPELVGSNNNQTVTGTRFNVLTYIPAGASSIIQKRIETEVVKCSCQYGAGGTNLGEIYRTAQWPAIWTGERYDVFEPDSVANAPGQALNAGPKSGVQQSPLCQECCRDHHDTATTGVAKFDPERSGGSTKYDSSLVAVTNILTGAYINSCRIIRVDGFWRTGADLYSRQFGLLETESVSGVKAKTGLPTTAATAAYTNFVKGYLQQYTGSVATAPTNAQTMFDATAGINDPTVVPIAAASTTDYRYLHGRGLYVDYLETAARAKLVSVLADTGTRGKCPTGTPQADCVLPYLPFTSANLTEIAAWNASDLTVLTVNSANLLATNPTLPSGSRSTGKKTGTSDNTASLRHSNSGIAVSSGLTFGGVDPADDTSVVSDLQPFSVGGATTSVGDDFFVTVTGGGVNPFVFYIIAGDSGECVKLGNGTRPCETNSTLPASGSIRLENYSSETDITQMKNLTCSSDSGNITGAYSVAVPTFSNYEVESALIGTVAASISTPVNSGKRTETTLASFNSPNTIPKNATVNVTISLEGTVEATLASCTVSRQNANKPWGISSISWTRPWLLP